MQRTVTLGDRVRQERDRAKWSQAELARAADVGRDAVVSVENGNDPRASTVARLSQALAERLVDHDAGWLLTGCGGRVGAVERRDFLRRAAAVGSGLAPVPTTLAHQVIQGLERRHAAAGLDDTLLDYWEGLTEKLAAGRPIMPPRDLLPQLEMHLTTMYMRLQQSAPERPYRRLASITAGTSAISAWVSLMAQRPDETHSYLDLGERLAVEAGDSDILALLLMLRADSLSPVKSGGLGGLPQEARSCLDRAMRLVSPSTPVSIGAPVILRAAEEHAAAGHVAEARVLLERGRDVIAKGRVQTHYLRRFLPDFLVDSFAGSIHQLLGEPAEAIRVLGPIKSPYAAHRPLLHADQGAAYAQLGEPDAASGMLGLALAEATELGHLEAVHRVHGVRRHRLAPWSDEPAVRQLDEQLAQAL